MIFSLDFTARRSGGTPTSTRNDQPVPLPGLGVVEVEGLIYRGITEKDFIYDSTKWRGRGTSGTVFKMEFKKREVAVKQISKSDDADETKVTQPTLFFDWLKLLDKNLI